MVIQEKLEACWFLFQKVLISCSLWCLYVELQILWFYSIKPPHIPLFSAANRYSKVQALTSLSYVGQIKVSGTAPGAIAMSEECCTPLPPSWERGFALSEIMSSHAGHSQSPLFLFVLSTPQVSKLSWFYQCSKWGKTKTSPLGSPWKSYSFGHILHSPFPLQVRSSEARPDALLMLSCVGLGKELTQIKRAWFFCSFQCGYSWLCAHLGITAT